MWMGGAGPGLSPHHGITLVGSLSFGMDRPSVYLLRIFPDTLRLKKIKRNILIRTLLVSVMSESYGCCDCYD